MAIQDTTEKDTPAASESSVEQKELSISAPASPAAPEGTRDRRQVGRRTSRRPVRRERPRSEFDQKIISIRRVTRVVAGGRRFNFSVAIVIGNRKGAVGVGIGKGADTALAIDKAVRNAKRTIIRLPLNAHMQIPHDVEAKYSSARVMIFPTRGGGLTAGSSVRTVLELAGVRGVSAKILSRSKNQLNNARAALGALAQLRS